MGDYHIITKEDSISSKSLTSHLWPFLRSEVVKYFGSPTLEIKRNHYSSLVETPKYLSIEILKCLPFKKQIRNITIARITNISDDVKAYSISKLGVLSWSCKLHASIEERYRYMYFKLRLQDFLNISEQMLHEKPLGGIYVDSLKVGSTSVYPYYLAQGLAWNPYDRMNSVSVSFSVLILLVQVWLSISPLCLHRDIVVRIKWGMYDTPSDSIHTMG